MLELYAGLLLELLDDVCHIVQPPLSLVKAYQTRLIFSLYRAVARK